MRQLTWRVALIVALLGLAGPLWAQAEPAEAAEKPAGDEAAAEPAAPAEEADGAATGQPADDTMRLNLEDLKDLRDADIQLPGLDLPGQEEVPAAGQDAPKEGEGEAEEPQINPAEVAQRIIEGMDESSERLSKMTDPGEQTQTVQKKVVGDLEELIEYVKQQQAQSQSQQQNQDQQSQRDSQQARRRQQQRQQQQGRGQGRQQQRSQQAMQDEQATHGQVQEEDLEAVAKLMEESWGNLLQNPSRETMQAVPEMILEKYRSLLVRYYTTLAREKAEQGAEGESP